MAEAPLVGVDLLDLARLEVRLNRHPDLAATLFTPAEEAYCSAQQRPVEHLGARFCAKEAVMKALGLDGWDPLDIEVVGGGAEVALRLHGDAARRADELGVEVTISLSHVSAMAIAVAMARPSP